MLDAILKEAGYISEGGWFLKKEKGIYHTAIVYNDQKIRLYASDRYITEDAFIYDTGRLKINSAELIFLLNILNR